MNMPEITFDLIKALGGLGLLGWIIGYSVTFTNAKLIERRLQRRELQYLHNSLTFILFMVLIPLIYSNALVFSFPKLTSSENLEKLLIILSVSSSLQILNILVVLYVNKYSHKKIKAVSEFITKHTKSALGASFIIFLFSSFSWLILIIAIYQYNDVVTRISVIPVLFSFYLALFLPYYWGFIKKLNKDVLVNIYLQDGKVLTNLLLSHRTFGNDLVFYEINDDFRLKALIINKDNIQRFASIEYLAKSDTTASQEELKKFSERINNPDLDNKRSTQSKKNKKK